MNERHDPDTLSIQIKLAGKSVLLRNTLIGAALCMALMTAIYANVRSGIEAAGVTLVGGLMFGAFTAFIAWLGQLAARSTSEGQSPNRRAVWYSGLIGTWLGIGFFALAFVSESGNDFGTSAVMVLIAMIFGALAGVAVSVPGATIREAMRTKESARQMLGEGQFDPLQQPQRLKDEARR